MPITAEKAPKVLPDKGKEIFVAAFNSSYETTCKDEVERDACASKIAWSAVKRKFTKGADGNWVPKALDESNLAEMSLYISKASFDKKTGEMRWLAVASDTEEDLTKESMSLELFSDFIARAEGGVEIPEEFKSSYWSGGMPYVSVSHYPDCDGKASGGICQALYVDGNRLKAKGIFYPTDLGRACFKSVCDSLYGDAQVEKKVRISIGFLDWAHSHGDNNTFERKSIDDYCMQCLMDTLGLPMGRKVYLKGQLIHLALTREPANPRTDIIDYVEVTKSMATQKSDAESIVGEALAELIEEESKKVVGKSMALVTKTDAEVPDLTEQADEVTPPVVEVKAVTEETDEEDDMPCSGTHASEDKSMAFMGEWEAKFTGMLAKMETLLVKPAPVEAVTHPLDVYFSEIKKSFDTVSTNKSMTGEEKLMVIQEPFEALGQVIKSTMSTPSAHSTPETSTSTQTELNVETLKSAFQEAMQPLNESVRLLLQYSSAPTGDQISRQNAIPVRRSAVATPFTGAPQRPLSVETSSTPKLRDIINRSVYGR